MTNAKNKKVFSRIVKASTLSVAVLLTACTPDGSEDNSGSTQAASFTHEDFANMTPEERKAFMQKIADKLPENSWKTQEGFVQPKTEEEKIARAMLVRPEIREGVGADATAGGRPKGSGGWIENTSNLPDVANMIGTDRLPVKLPNGVQDPIQQQIKEWERHTGETHRMKDSHIYDTFTDGEAVSGSHASASDRNKSITSQCGFNNKVISTDKVRVIDGDTLEVIPKSGRSERVRLIGIDAPESSQPFGADSTKSLKACVANNIVDILWDKKDPYGRLLGKAIVNGQDCNLSQVQKGMAWHYKDYEATQYEVDRIKYSNAEVGARLNKTGLWSSDDLVAPWDYRKERKSEYVFKDNIYDASLAKCEIGGIRTK